MGNFFETEKVIVPFSKVARVSKALDKNGKVYSVNVFLDGAESATFTEGEAARFLVEFKPWLDRAENTEHEISFGNLMED